MIIASKGGNIMNEDNKNNFILVDEDKPKEKKWKKIVKILLVVAIVCSFAMNGYVFYNMMSSSSDSTTTVTNKGTVKQVNYDVKTDTTSVVEKASDSVVGVVVYKNTTNNAFGFGDNSSSSSETQSGSGSGVVYDKTGKYTYIITNHHVIDGANKVQVVFSNNEYVDAEVVGSDEYSDVAILRCQPSFDVSVIDLGDSNLLDKGETVLAIGSPLGIQYSGTVTQGIVSATDRTVSVDLNDDKVDDWDMNVIQTDAAINPGNSGGALVNMKGELVGITNMKFSDESVEGMGFAIPISKAEPILDEMMNQETRYKVEDEDKAAYIGITCENVTSDVNQMYGIPQGVYVDTVVEGGPAEKAGIKKGDVITKIDGTAIDAYKDLVDRLEYYEAGETVELEVYRAQDGEYNAQKISVTLGAKKDAPSTNSSSNQQQNEKNNK